MSSKFKTLLIWALTTLALMLVDNILAYPQNWIWKILPSTIFRLNKDLILGLLVTFTTSFMAWVSAVLFGSLLGFGTAAVVLYRGKSKATQHIGFLIDKIYDSIYIIPFVLTIGLSYAIAMTLHLNFAFPRFGVALILIFVAGLALGGYHVYKGVYEAVYHSKKETDYLVQSLYSPYERAGLWNSVRYYLHKARLYRDCEILTFCQGIERALYLAVVAVMIVEAVVPHFYEYIYPQKGAVKPWLGGIGRQIIDAQNAYQFELISGCIWAVIFFSWALMALADAKMQKYWLVYYKEK